MKPRLYVAFCRGCGKPTPELPDAGPLRASLCFDCAKKLVILWLGR